MKRESQVRGTFKTYPSDKKEIIRLHRVSGLTWPSFVKYVNRLVKEDLNQKAVQQTKADLGSKSARQNLYRLQKERDALVALNASPHWSVSVRMFASIDKQIKQIINKLP